MSASAPAGRTNRTNGSDDDVWTRPTSVADCESSVISHAEPTFSIQSPMFEASAASQSERNVARPSGANGLLGVGASRSRAVGEDDPVTAYLAG